MIYRPNVNRLLIIGFMILVGFCLAKGIYSQSVTAIVLAIVSFVAGVYFLHLLQQAKADMDMELEENK